MDDRLSSVESQIRDLERSLATFERRLTALERDRGYVPASAPAESDLGALPGGIPPDQFGATISYVGRTFVALGGAYLLRALTDSAIVPPRIGIALGMLYAFTWLAAADRAAGRGRRLSAAFHALVASLIAFPLLWEATVRFEDLSPTGSAIALSIVTVIAFGVAVRRNLQPVAWIVTCAALPTAIATISMTGALATFAVYLIALGLLTLWVGYAWNWVWLRWPVAFVADMTVVALTLSGVGTSSPQSPAIVIAVQMLLLNGYLASIVVRTIIRAREVIGFEIVQTLATLAVGFGGAVYIAERTGSGAALLAIINLVFGVGCYVVAFVFMRQGRPRNFYFYSSLAIVLVTTSSTLLLSPAMLAIVSVALAIAAVWTGGRLSNVTLTVHGVTYLVTAGIASELLAAAAFALAAPVSAQWVPFSAAAIITVVGYVICWLLSPLAGSAPLYTRVPRALVVALLVWGGAGAVVALFTAGVSRAIGAAADAGVVATIRTATLAAAAVALAWAGQRDRFRESAWLLYPVLAAGGIKLLIEDLPLSKPATLFVALAAYGLALIAAPRLSHHRPT
jgi:hypothetical protein